MTSRSKPSRRAATPAPVIMANTDQAPAYVVGVLDPSHVLYAHGYRYQVTGSDGRVKSYTVQLKAAGILAAGWRKGAAAALSE